MECYASPLGFSLSLGIMHLRFTHVMCISSIFLWLFVKCFIVGMHPNFLCSSWRTFGLNPNGTETALAFASCMDYKMSFGPHIHHQQQNIWGLWTFCIIWAEMKTECMPSFFNFLIFFMNCLYCALHSNRNWN